MKVINPGGRLPVFPRKSSVTVGVFDGVHIGHRRLIERTIDCADRLGGKSVVVTFSTLPENHLGNKGLKLIKSIHSRLKRLRLHGVDYACVVDFARVRDLSPAEFVSSILVKKLNIGCITAGRDFVFGRGGAGDVSLLKKLGAQYGFRVNIVPDVMIKGERVSSTRIRKHLKDGDIKLVERMLGRPYTIEGKVQRGRHVGFEFPTANLALDYDEIPARGVWAVKVTYAGRSYTGAANIGFAPTLKNEKKQLLEVFIFDFKKAIYGRTIKVTFLEFLRPEKKFGTHEALLRQVEKDIAYIKRKWGKKP